MEEKDINYLRDCIKNQLLVFWRNSVGALQEIVHIGIVEDEGAVAYIKGALGCPYVALYNVVKEDFVIAEEVGWTWRICPSRRTR